MRWGEISEDLEAYITLWPIENIEKLKRILKTALTYGKVLD